MRAGRVAGLLVVAAVLAACNEQESLPSDTRAPVVTETTVVPTSVTVAAVSSLEGATVELEQLARVEEPTAMAFWPGDDASAYVTGQAGRVRRVDLADGALSEAIDIRDMVGSGGERGLLGLAFSPDGERLYLSYTNLDGDSRIDEYRVGPEGLHH